MAGRRWAQGGPSDQGGGKHRPRPSERAGGATPQKETRVSKRLREQAERAAIAANRPAPSDEAILRAKERLSPPKAPWHPLPLAEMAIVIGFLVLIVGLALNNFNGAAAGFGLTLIGVIEFSWREHRHGFRSHGAVLGGLIGLIAAMICWKYVGLTRYACMGVGLAVFLAAWGLFTKTYVAEEDREGPTRGGASTAG